MKGGNTYKIRGKHFSFTLIILVFTTIFFWSLEKRPFVSNLLSAQDQYVFPTSDTRLTDSHVTKEFEKPNDPPIQDLSHLHEETGDETDVDRTVIMKESTATVSSESEDDKDLVSFSDRTEDNEKLASSSFGKDDKSLLSSSDRKEDYKNLSSSDMKEDNKNLATSSYREVLHTGDGRLPVCGRPLSPCRMRHMLSILLKAQGFNCPRLGMKECNYAKGRWVVDNRRPLYSGFKCKQWLSDMWACRLTQRPDFSYEAYRWLPLNCEMPEFMGSEFLKRMQDKTIAFVGDSLGRQQFQSLMCMVTGGEEHPEVEDVGHEYGFVVAPGAARPDGWAFRFPDTNTTILYHWSSCLCDLEPLNTADPGSEVAMHLDRPPAFLKRFLHRLDALILNTGHHWNRGKVNANRWVMYIDGKPNKNRRLAMIGNAKNLTIHSVVRWLDMQLPSHPRLKAFFRTISPRHFFNGEWNTGGSCENITPLARGSEVNQDESSDPVIAGAVRGTKVKLLDITALSQLRDEGHISRYSIKATQGIQDCLHWCLPGVPDIWNEVLAAQI